MTTPNAQTNPPAAQSGRIREAFWRGLGRLSASALIAFCVVFPGAMLTSHAAPALPNILFIVVDDLGWRDVGWHGGKFQTPVTDGLVKGGVELDQHYVQPVCTPTRTALMSGRYPSRFGPQALAPSNLRAIPPGTETMASALKSLGYATCMAGKWHLGSRQEWGPNHYGFGHSYGSLTGAVDPWTHKYRKGPWEDTWHRDGQRIDEEGNATELVAAQIVKWIKDQHAPWFIYVAFHAIHVPVDAPPEYKARYAGVKFHDDPEKQDSLLRLAAMVTQVDTKIGEFVAALEQTGQREKTLIIFTSDNGGKTKSDNPYIGTVPASPANSDNAPLRGEKGGLYEGGIRVPAFANWPGTLAPRKVAAPMHAVDWFPTIAKLTGYQPAKDLNWDGMDLWPAITGKVAQPEPRTIYIPLRKVSALRHGDWKLIDRADGVFELFNLADDPSEKTDLAMMKPKGVQELRARLEQIQKNDRKNLPEDLVGIPD